MVTNPYPLNFGLEIGLRIFVNYCNLVGEYCRVLSPAKKPKFEYDFITNTQVQEGVKTFHMILDEREAEGWKPYPEYEGSIKLLNADAICLLRRLKS